MDIVDIMHDESSTPHDLKWLAYWLARYLLRDKVDKQGRPLIEHSMRVAARCGEMSLSDEQQIAAILHDCIEDGELASGRIWHSHSGASTIDALFGGKVYRIVRRLSRDEEMSYADYIEGVSLLPEAIPIKLADLADNLDTSRGPIPDSLRERYEKAQAYLLQAQTQKGTTDK